MILIALSGCARRVPRPAFDPLPADPPPIVEEPLVVEEIEETPPPPEPVIEPQAPLRVAVLLSAQQKEYEAVYASIVASSGEENVKLFPIETNALRARETIEAIRAAEYESVVAIGLLAARWARQLEDQDVVFCQVFNYADHDLLGPRSRGVLTTPMIGDAIRVWKSLGSPPSRVGVITGSGHEVLIESARTLFAKNGIELVHRVTSSDKQTSLEYKRMLPSLDGYWLLPDNRVLSRTALRELMSLARQRGVGVLVNDPRFLELGGLISASLDPKDIGEVVCEMLLESRDDGEFRTKDMYILEKGVIEINADLATDLGLNLEAVDQRLLAR